MGLLCVTVASRLLTSQGALQFQDFATTLPEGKQRKVFSIQYVQSIDVSFTLRDALFLLNLLHPNLVLS